MRRGEDVLGDAENEGGDMEEDSRGGTLRWTEPLIELYIIVDGILTK